MEIGRRTFLSTGVSAGFGLLAGCSLPGGTARSETFEPQFDPAAQPDFRPPVRALTRQPGFHWFGYYDKFQFDLTDRYVLGMRVGFEHRTPRPDDEIEIGMVDLLNGDRWIRLGSSRAWCWQQGCMLPAPGIAVAQLNPAIVLPRIDHAHFDLVSRLGSAMFKIDLIGQNKAIVLAKFQFVVVAEPMAFGPSRNGTGRRKPGGDRAKTGQAVVWQHKTGK